MRAARLVAPFTALLLSGCGQSYPCEGYPVTLVGTMTGAGSSGSFSADLQLQSAGAGVERTTYTGTFTGSGGSTGTVGEFWFDVDCTSQELIAGGWRVQDGTTTGPQGTVTGSAPENGATGSWGCTIGCDMEGSWAVAPPR